MVASVLSYYLNDWYKAGLEPTPQHLFMAYAPALFQLSYLYHVDLKRIELLSSTCKTDVLPLNYKPYNILSLFNRQAASLYKLITHKFRILVQHVAESIATVEMPRIELGSCYLPRAVLSNSRNHPFPRMLWPL